MLSDRVYDLSEQYETLVLVDTVTHRALVALYIDLLGAGGAMSDEDMQEMVNAFMREACTEALFGLGWLHFACGEKILGAPSEEGLPEEERDFNTLMMIFAVNAIHGFPEQLESQQDLFGKVHQALQASIEAAGPGIVQVALEDLEDILLGAAKEELLLLCRERGMAEEESSAALQTMQAAFQSEGASGLRFN